MTTLLANIQQLLDSGNTNGAREEAARAIAIFNTINVNLRDFAAILALGSQQALEIALGELGRKLLKNNTEINPEAIWLLLAAVLSRANISSESPARISLLGLISSVENWREPIFTLLVPALDSFLKVSLSQGNALIAEQTLDFLANAEESYATIPRTKQQRHELLTSAKLVLDKVDDREIQDEWQEGLNTFEEIAGKAEYSDRNVWSAAYDLVKKVYTSRVLSSDDGASYSQTKDSILQFIASSLAALGVTLEAKNKGLSVAVRIENIEKNRNFWSMDASAVDTLQRLFQEISDLIFDKSSELPEFTSCQATPGSWSILLHMDLEPKRSKNLANAIVALSSIESSQTQSNSFLEDSWQNFLVKLQKAGLKVVFAIATNVPELHIVRAVSTESPQLLKTVGKLEENIRIFSRDVPQADNLDRVLDLASLLIQYPDSPATVLQKFRQIEGITYRQFRYYQCAVEILGLADERERPTNACFTLNRLQSSEQKIRFLAYQFISSNVGVAWFRRQNANDLTEIEPETAFEFLEEACPSLAAETVKRRAKTLQAWLKRFLENW